MADTDHLVRLALAAVGRAEHLEGAGVAHRAEVAPELRGDAPVVGVLHHALEFAVLDQLAPFAAELELVACVVDRPGAVVGHQHPALDTGHQLREALVAGLQVEIGHAVDGRAVPTAGAAVGDALQAAAVLRQGAAERTQQAAFADQVFLARGAAVVVLAVAGQLLGDFRVEADVEQAGAVLVATEVLGLDEAGTGVVALVAEDAIQLQRVADRLVDLQDHLVRHQQQVAAAARGVRRRQQLQGLVGDARRGADQAEALDHFGAALLAGMVAAETAGLAVMAVVGGDAGAGIDEALLVVLLGAGAVQVELFLAADFEEYAPVHQALVARHLGGFLGEQFVALGEGGERGVLVRRAILRAAACRRQSADVEQGVPGDPLGLPFGLLQGGLQAGRGEIVGGGVGFHAVQPYAEHGAAVLAEVRRFADVAAHREVLAATLDVAQGVEFGATAERREAVFQRVDHLCVPGRLRSGRMQNALFQAFVRNGASRLLS